MDDTHKTFSTGGSDDLYLPVPDWLGRGACYETKIGRGLELWVLNCAVAEEMIFNAKGSPPVIQFHYNLAGQYRIQFDSQEITVGYEDEHLGIYFYGDTNSIWKLSPVSWNKFVSVRIYPEFFADCEQNFSVLVSFLEKLLKSNNKNSCRCINEISPQLLGILEHILACRLTGPERKRFLESRLFSLLLYQLVKLSASSKGEKKNGNIHSRDRETVEYARKHLVKNFQSPICIPSLAKIAGMPHAKLNRCFKQFYGMTVCQYLRHERLVKAKELLQNGDISVTEVAFLVGYHSPSHFSKSYKEKFGVLPGNF